MAAPCTKRVENKDSADLYSTPIEALEAIKEHLLLDISSAMYKAIILEPCAGLNVIRDWVRDNLPHTSIYTNELNSYKIGYDYNMDFIGNTEIPDGFDIILTNPPYNKAVEFILQGFEHAPVQWHLLRMSFLEGQKRFQELFSLGKLSDVYIFTYRISCPKGVDMEPSPNSVCYCWFRFDKNYFGQPKLHWLTK